MMTKALQKFHFCIFVWVVWTPGKSFHVVVTSVLKEGGLSQHGYEMTEQGKLSKEQQDMESMRVGLIEQRNASGGVLSDGLLYSLNVVY